MKNQRQAKKNAIVMAWFNECNRTNFRAAWSKFLVLRRVISEKFLQYFHGLSDCLNMKKACGGLKFAYH